MKKKKVLNKGYLKRCKVCERFVLKTHLDSYGWCKRCVMESKKEISDEKKRRQVYGVTSILSYDFITYGGRSTTITYDPYIQELLDHIETEQKKLKKQRRK